MPTGSGSGPMPGSGSGPMPTGSGSGEMPFPILPITGPMPHTGDCGNGFVLVCPQKEGRCPRDSKECCPKPDMMRMLNEGGHNGCECVPMVLMQMVMYKKDYEGRSLDRKATVETYKKVKVTIKKKKCTCEFRFTVDGCKVTKSAGKCDAKCVGVAKRIKVGKSYTVSFTVQKKGKVIKLKVDKYDCPKPPPTKPPPTRPPPTRPPSGSGTGTGPGSGTGPALPTDNGCVCVFGMPDSGY